MAFFRTYVRLLGLHGVHQLSPWITSPSETNHEVIIEKHPQIHHQIIPINSSTNLHSPTPKFHLFRASTAVLKGHGTFDHLMVEPSEFL